MDSPPARRFTLADAMILIAAIAVAIAWTRSAASYSSGASRTQLAGRTPPPIPPVAGRPGPGDVGSGPVPDSPASTQADAP